MSYHWSGTERALPIVEIHDVRAERQRAPDYMRMSDRLTPALVASGGRPLGQFAVAGHPDRLLVLRGFASMAARRQALGSFHAGTAWAAERQAAAELTRQAEIMLMRSIAPADGLTPLGTGQGAVALISELRFAEQLGSYHLWLRLLLRKADCAPRAVFATLAADNDVPAVPVLRHRIRHVALLPPGGRPPALPVELRDMLRFAPEVLTLAPQMQFVW